MCGIWRTPPRPELSLEAWLEMLADPLFADLRELDVTGGEPFLRDDLVELVARVAKLAHRNLRRLRSVAITTNALLTDQVVEGAGRMAHELDRAGVDLVLVCAMDGVGETHDAVRSVPGAWLRLEKTLAGLRALRDRRDNVVVGLKTTIVPSNVDQLDPIAEYAERHGYFTIVSPAIVTEGRYLNADAGPNLTFDRDDVTAMLRFYRTRGGGWDYHRRVMADYLENGKTSKPCTCGFNSLFVRSDGKVHLCPLLPAPVGDLTRSPIGAIWTSASARRSRQGMGAHPQCRACTEPGLERYALPFEGRAYLSLMARLGPTRFLAAHRHMGLDKYM
jgi:MoaA/NifB/PqqE/SkfB family radical SAM enzyme